ncbi:MAG TPA: hypothetical protein VK812_04305 [Candidatus Binatus sp.]|jgi:hypothetical protein|nr:hypothetical protein [Candidatus Binatus sp.]
MKYPSSALAGTLLLGLAAAVAQQSSTPVRWAEGAPNATSEMKNDTKIEGLKTDDVHIFASIADLKETQYNRVWIQVANHGKTPIDFDPQAVVLVNVVKEKMVAAEVPDKAAKSIEKFGEAKSQEMSSAKCENMAATQCQPAPAQLQVARQISAYSSQQAQWIRDNALTKKTLAPGEEVQGIVVFRKDKKAASYILRCPVGTQIFEFPVTAENKEPSYD